ncbi:MAG: esterase/lipase family protein, partial [Crocinitomicaceae bacterium]
MRKISLIIYTLTALQIFAQGNNSSQQDINGPAVPFTQQISELFQHVDLSEVQQGSGVLYEHGYPYCNLDAFDGVISNENETSVTAFGLAYASIYSMALNNSQRLPDPAGYRNIMDVIGEDSPVIPLAVLHQSYAAIDPLSLTDNLLTELNGQFYDVPNRSRSPYLNKECFMVVPAATRIKGNSLTLKYDVNLMFNNTGKQLTGLFIDMDNGLGYQQTQLSSNVSAQYTTLGEKEIKFKASYSDGSTYESYAIIALFDEFIDDLLNTDFFIPDETHHITAEEGYLGDDGEMHYGSGTMRISFGCGHTSLQKPFIWAEGYNPLVGYGDQAIDLSLGHIDAVRRLDEIQIGGKALTDYLYDEGYDLVTLDYDDGGDYLPATANFIKEVIGKINQMKANAGSVEKNVIIGQSMGGMCTRYALRDMEVNGEDHEVSTYISFDSAHQGLNAPIGVQHLCRHIASAPVLDIVPLASFVTRLENLKGLLDLPASRTMMKYQPDDVASLNADYYNVQNNVLGMPVNCEVLAIANGAGAGVPSGQNFDAGELVLHSKETSISIMTGRAKWKNPKRTEVATAVGTFLAWELGTFAWSNLRVWAMPAAPSPSGPVYKGTLGVSFLGITIINTTRERFAVNFHGIDHVQGALIFPHNLSSPALDIPTDLIPDVYKLQGFCFTPTTSTLNYYDGGPAAFTNLEHNITNTFYEIENNNVRDIDNYVVNSIVDDYGTFIEFKNSKHTWFTAESHAFMLYHLTGTDMLSGETVLDNNDVFQYGKGEVTFETTYISSAPIRTQSIQPYSLTFKDNSRLYVNASGTHRIGLTPNTDYSEPHLPPYTKDVSHFRLDIRNKCEETGNITITIEENAQMVIGDNVTRTGEVVVHSGHKIVVKNGGQLIIHKNSRLTLLANSQLVVEPGGILMIEDGGKLVTKWGGDIVFHENADVHLRGHDAEMDLTGQLFLMPNADFRPLHDGVSSGRILVRCPVGLLAGMSGSRFRLIGNNDGDHMLTIIENGSLVANMEMEQLLFASCKVVYRSERWNAISSYTNFTSSNVTYDTQSNLEDIDHHGALNLFGKSLVVSSDFNNIDLYAHPEVDYDGYFLNISGCTFQHSYFEEDDLLHVKGGNLFLNNSDFSTFTRKALRTEELDAYSQIHQNNFNGVGSLSTGVDDRSYT